MTNKRFIKGLIVGTILTLLVMWYMNKKKLEKKQTEDPAPELLPEPEPEPVKELKSWVEFNETSDDLREFEENCNTIADRKFFAGVGAADDHFFRVSEELNENTDNIFVDDKVNLNFIKNFNIFYARMRGERDFREVKGTGCGSEGIKKGDKSKEVNMFKETLNSLAETNLRIDGNYNRELYNMACGLLKGTSAYNEENDGWISSCFIRNSYYLVINLLK